LKEKTKGEKSKKKNSSDSYSDALSQWSDEDDAKDSKIH